MKDFSRYLTTRNVLSWPVICITAVWLVFANLVDSSTNGLGNIGERVLIVLGTQAVFIAALFLCDLFFIRRVTERRRWLVLWVTIAVLAVGRGLLLAAVWVAFGFSQDLAPWSRAIAGLTNLGLLMVFIAVAYGMLASAARQRRELHEAQVQLIELRQASVENRVAQNEALIEKVRTRMAEALAPELLDTPENTVLSIRASIDEVIRPLSHTLSQRPDEPDVMLTSSRARIDLKRYLSRVVNIHELDQPPGLVLFFLLMLTPLVNVFGPIWAPVIGVAMVCELFILTWFLRWASLRTLPRVALWASPVILVVSGLSVAVTFVSLMPIALQPSYVVGVVGVYFFCSLVPVALRIAVDEAHAAAEALERENADLRWSLVRSNEVAQQQNRVVAAALHGRLQAALAAAAFRLQIALRDGVNPADAQELARLEAEKAIVFDVDFDEAPRPVAETLAEISELWRGVCVIQCSANEGTIRDIEQDPVCARLCGELIIELCTNAIKHGKATYIEISVEPGGDRLIDVEIKNNGVDVAATREGYGTQLLNQSCIGWSQVRQSDMTSVRAQVPWVRPSS